MSEMGSVADRMSPSVLTVSPSETLDRVAQVMWERRVGSAVIVKDDEVKGIMTERDVLAAVARGLVPWNTPVEDCMTASPTTVSPSTSGEEALQLMRKGGFRHLPVCKDGALAGIVSLRDLTSSRSEQPSPQS